MNAGPTFGDVHDNLAAFSLARYEMEHGNTERGKQTLCSLSDYIRTTRDIQSVVWVLPHVEAALQHATGPGFPCC